MLSQSVKHGHQGISLLAPFSLFDDMGCAFVVIPEILRRLGIEDTEEGNQGGCCRKLKQFAEHLRPGDVVAIGALGATSGTPGPFLVLLRF